MQKKAANDTFSSKKKKEKWNVYLIIPSIFVLCGLCQHFTHFQLPPPPEQTIVDFTVDLERKPVEPLEAKTSEQVFEKRHQKKMSQPDYKMEKKPFEVLTISNLMTPNSMFRAVHFSKSGHFDVVLQIALSAVPRGQVSIFVCSTFTSSFGVMREICTVQHDFMPEQKMFEVKWDNYAMPMNTSVYITYSSPVAHQNNQLSFELRGLCFVKPLYLY